MSEPKERVDAFEAWTWRYLALLPAEQDRLMLGPARHVHDLAG
jgi:hypothetical protein